MLFCWSARNLFLAFAAQASLATIAFGGYPALTSVGDAGNKADTSGYGAVSYEYKIGKYEVTNEEYCEFLNAVGKSDPNELYDGRMAEDYGGITRSGDYGSYSYSVKAGCGKKPINYVTFASCARYANWLTNGQGKGDTESGSYAISGDSIKVLNHAEAAKEKKVKWAVASENEWYKAAYYDPKKAGGAGYWQYPTKSDTAPSANLNSDSPSEAGSFKDVVTAYGTYDQGGNMWEYNDNETDGKYGLRGGSFYINDNEGYMLSFTRYDVLSAKWPNYGFRVVALGATGESAK